MARTLEDTVQEDPTTAAQTRTSLRSRVGIGGGRAIAGLCAVRETGGCLNHCWRHIDHT